MKRGTSLGLLVGGLMIASQSLAAPMIVVEARGAGLRPGMRLDSAATINLKDGERVTLIGADGQAVTLRGTYAGVLTNPTNPVAGLQTLPSLEAAFGLPSGSLFRSGTGNKIETEQDTDAYTLFGQLDFDLTDQLTPQLIIGDYIPFRFAGNPSKIPFFAA